MSAESHERSEERPVAPGEEAEQLLLFSEAWTRRVFLRSMAGGAGLVLSQPLIMMEAAEPPPDHPPLNDADGLEVHLKINGTATTLKIDPRVTLLDALRDRMGLTGTKKGCDHGQCGACTVLVNGRRVNSCLCLALSHDGAEVTTIEGLADGDQLHPVQAAFIEHDGFQCGYCTPGQICSAVALLKENHARSDDEIREWMSGNICRCGAYANIVAAIRSARSKMPAHV